MGWGRLVMNKIMISRETGFFEIDLETKAVIHRFKVNPIDEHLPHSTGMSFIEDKFYCLVGSTLNVCDSNYKVVESHDTSLLKQSPHQMVAHVDKLYIANTAGDSIVIFDTKTKEWDEIKITGSGADTKHVNSIHFENDVMFVMCHNRGPSEIIVLGQDRKLIDKIPAGEMSHNIFKLNGGFWFLNSKNDSVDHINGKGLKIPGNGFLRGVALFDKFFVVASTKRKGSLDPSFSGLTIVNNNFKVVEQIPIDCFFIGDILKIPSEGVWQQDKT
jgi:hypothetical protein